MILYKLEVIGLSLSGDLNTGTDGLLTSDFLAVVTSPVTHIQFLLLFYTLFNIHIFTLSKFYLVMYLLLMF